MVERFQGKFLIIQSQYSPTRTPSVPQGGNYYPKTSATETNEEGSVIGFPDEMDIGSSDAGTLGEGMSRAGE